MSDPLAEVLHEAYHTSKEAGSRTVDELAAGMAQAIRNSPDRLAIAASLLTEEDVARAIATDSDGQVANMDEKDEWWTTPRIFAEHILSVLRGTP